MIWSLKISDKIEFTKPYKTKTTIIFKRKLGNHQYFTIGMVEEVYCANIKDYKEFECKIFQKWKKKQQ